MNTINFIDQSASIGKKVTIGNFVTIHRGVCIGSGTKIEDGVIIYENCKIANNCIVGANCVLRPKTQVGHHTIIGPLVLVNGNCFIGNYNTINGHSQISFGSKIGNCCFIGTFFASSNTRNITDGKHGTAKNKKKPKISKTIIEDYVRIGIRVTMTPGNKIGHHSIIFQNALISSDIPPHSIIVGRKDKIGKI